jgi:hypothetical protein
LATAQLDAEEREFVLELGMGSRHRDPEAES